MRIISLLFNCMLRPLVSAFAIPRRTFSTSIANMKHHLMVGTWTKPGRIYTVQFDDEALTLELVKKTDIPEAEPISWMTFSHDKKAIYGAAMKKWNSFAVNSPTEIVHQVSHPVAGHRTFQESLADPPLTLSSSRPQQRDQHPCHLRPRCPQAPL
jgi:hypothetical protein